MDHLVDTRLSEIAGEIESNHRFPEKARDLFVAEGLFTLALPRRFGGQGADALSLALMIEAIARKAPSAALLVFPTNAVVRIIALTGDNGQRERFLKEAAKGDVCMAFSLTEPDAGSAAFDLTTRAVRDGDDYLVSGVKSFVTLARHSRYYLTFVRTGPGPKAGGVSALLIPGDAPGVSFGPPEKKMGLYGSVTCQMYLDGVRVPRANRLMGEGQGWRVLTEAANPMRVWGAASMSLGIAQGVFDLALAHARRSRDGGAPLIREQATGFCLADMKMQIEACRSLVHRVSRLVDQEGADPGEIAVMTSAAKCFAADTAMKVANLAGDVLGTEMMREDSAAARFFCSAKAIQIFDGSNQVQRMVISRNLAD